MLTAPFAEAKLRFSNADTTASGVLNGGGDLCQVVGGGPVTGTQVAAAPSASLTGTFAGSVYPSPAGSGSGPETVGTVSIVLTQSTTPNSAGQFPLAGTFTYTSGACSATTSLTGLLSGLWITLASATGPSSGSLTAATNPAVSLIDAGQITFTPPPCSTASGSVTSLGILTRQ
ncbi:MAG: hypothetical protein ABR910_07690 [Acidobacteriaceae bacterium]